MIFLIFLLAPRPFYLRDPALPLSFSDDPVFPLAKQARSGPWDRHSHKWIFFNMVLLPTLFPLMCFPTGRILFSLSCFPYPFFLSAPLFFSNLRTLFFSHDPDSNQVFPFGFIPVLFRGHLILFCPRPSFFLRPDPFPPNMFFPCVMLTCLPMFSICLILIHCFLFG